MYRQHGEAYANKDFEQTLYHVTKTGLLDNVQWRKECAAKVGLGFVLPTNKQPAMIDKSGQVLRVEEQDAV